MRLLFVHDNPFVLDRDHVYSQGSISSHTWKRFLPHVDEIVVFARQREVSPQQLARLNRADADRVRFRLIHSLPYSRLIPGASQTHAALREEIGRADAVVLRLPSILGRTAGPLAQAAGKPVAAEVVGCPFDAYWNYGSLAGKALALIEPARMRRIVRGLPLAVYVTERFLQSRYPCRGTSETASNVELPCPPEALLARRLERIRQAPAGPTRIGLIGSYVHKYKGWDTAIRAVQRLHPDYRVELRLLGPGDPARVRDYASAHGVAEAIACDGVLPMGEPVMQWIDSMDLYIQPSLQEGLPRSVIEAMSRGLPCVGTRVAGIPELLDPACIIDKHDDAALAQRIERLITDRDFAAAQARRNFDAATGFYADRLEAHREAVWGRFLRPLRDGAGATMPPSPSD